ncbi:tail fiber protein [Tistrella sp. BH-R2-4]|uniref:Tail fiber protein n=1 Tax=Tistrella arctica TaxID=3133430 RepID=A0ABU9YSU3_9PROT
MDSPFIASIVPWAPDFAPRGWAYCRGQLLAISQYQSVFALIGTTYGGNGTNTFALPNLQSRTPVGTGHGPGLPVVSLGEAAGTETSTMTTANMPAHIHSAFPQMTASIGLSSAPATASDPVGKTLATASVRIGSGPGAQTFPVLNYAAGTPDTALTTTVDGTIGLADTGGSQPFPIIQPYQALHFIFAMTGIFPPRS